MSDKEQPQEKAPEEEYKYVMITTFGMPLIVPKSELLYYLTLSEGVEHKLFPFEEALFSEHDFMLHGWQQAG